MSLTYVDIGFVHPARRQEHGRQEKKEKNQGKRVAKDRRRAGRRFAHIRTYKDI